MRVFRPGWVAKALWGGLLSFVPVLNVLALITWWNTPTMRGYANGNCLNGAIKLSQSFAAVLCSLILLACGGPPVAGWLLSEIIELHTFDLWVVSHFPLALAGFAAPFFFPSASILLERWTFSDASKSVPSLQSQNFWPRLAVLLLHFGNFSSGYPSTVYPSS